MKALRLFVPLAAGLLGAIQARGSTIIYSNLQENALLCECSWHAWWPLGTLLAADAWDHFAIGNIFTTPKNTDFLLDDVEAACQASR